MIDGGKEAVMVAVDKSASAASRRYGSDTVWELGKKMAIAWAEKGPIDFIPFSASFTVYPSVDRMGVLDALSRETPGQSTRLSGVLRYCFNECIARSLSEGRKPNRLVVVCDGEPDDIIQVELEITRFMNRLPTSFPFYLEVCTQREWPELKAIFDLHSKEGGFMGYFNPHLFRAANDRLSNY